jgi:Ser/Thr protein kinase RdoA (MazF antagonist)
MPDPEPVLRHYPPDCQPAQLEPLGSAGGLSGAQFWRLVAPRATLALRRWPIEHPTPDGLRFIHAVLRHAERRGMTILPVPVPTASGESFAVHDGRLWEIEPWLLGTADYERSPSAEKLRAAMVALAGFHVATSDFQSPSPDPATAPAIATRLERLRELQSGGIDALVRAISDSAGPEMASLARQFVSRAPSAVPAAVAGLTPLASIPLPLQPCIRDIWHDHVLFDGDRVTGLIDFGAMQFDTPATDIARLVGSLAVFDKSRQTWPIALAAYSNIRPLNEAEITAAQALDAAGTILAGCNWIRWIYVDRRQFENPPRILERFRRIVSRLQY